MKLFKKVTALVMSLTMGFSIVACGGDGEKESKKHPVNDLLGGQIGETLKETINTITSNEDGDGAKYVAGLVNAAMQAKTVEMKMNFDFDGTSTYYTTSDSGENTTEVDVDSADGEITVTLAQTETGYDIAVVANVDTEDEAGPEKFEFYLIDGQVFSYDGDSKYWTAQSLPLNDMIGVLEESSILDMVAAYFPTEQVQAIYNLLGKVFDQACKVENNQLVFGGDMTETINSTIAQIKAIDMEQTAYEFFNKLLTDLGSEISLDKVLDKIATYGKVTIGDMYADFNAWLKKNCGADLNGLVDKVLEQKDIAALLTAFNVPADTLEAIKALDFSQYIEPMKDVSLDELLLQMMAGMGGSGEPMQPMMSPIGPGSGAAQAPEVSLKTLVEQLEAMLAQMPLGVLFEEMGFVGAFDGFTINQMKEVATISFDGFNMSGVDFEVGVDVATNDDDGASTTKLTAGMTLELKDTETTIALPATATDIYWLPSTYVSAGEYSLEGYILVSYDENDKASGELRCEVEIQVGEYIVRYDCSLTPVKYVAGEALQSITVVLDNMWVTRGTIENPSMFADTDYNWEWEDVAEGKQYTLTFDGTTINGISAIETPTEDELALIVNGF